MIDKEKEVFSGLLKKIYNLNDEEIASLYNDAGELEKVDLLLEKDSQRVARFKQEKNDQFKAGDKKANERIEKYLKEKFSVESDLLGTELIDYVIELQTTELKDKLNKKINPDDIEKHPAFINKRTEFEKQLKAKDKEWEDKLSAKESEWNRKQNLAQVSKSALIDVETNFILPENPSRAQALKDVLIRELESENYSIQEDGSIIILDKEGKAKEDAHGKMIQFKDHVDQLASKFFDKKQANARGSAGNQSQQNNTGSKIVVKDQSDFRNQLAAAKTSEERAAIMKVGKEAGLV